jgi:LAO/AO transport system kinase
LVESTKWEHQQQAHALINEILKSKSKLEAANKIDTFRVGISGSPGVGKSTFIDTFGVYLSKHLNYPVAVLAVDPSSTVTGGSILGDRTRMPNLTQQDNVFVRPSPSRGTLGGVTKSTNESILLCEEAGYKVVLVETVGVGQSEIAVAEMVDFFLMLAQPASGDELQGMKKGIVESADMIVVTKSDGDLAKKAMETQYEYMAAVKLMRPKYHDLWRPKVTRCSAVTGENIEKVWETMRNFWELMRTNGGIAARRGQQRQAWMWKLFDDELERRFRNNATIREQLPRIEQDVKLGTLSPTLAAHQLVLQMFQDKK